MAGQRYNPDTGEYEDIPDPSEGGDNPVVPGAPSTYWEGDEQKPIPSGSPAAPTSPSSASGSSGGGGGSRDYESELKSKLGDLYTPGALEELRHRDYDPGWMDRIVAKEQLRGSNAPNSEYVSNGKGGYLVPPGGGTMASAYGSYLGSAPGGGAAGGELSSLMTYLQQRQQQEDANRAALRDILLKQITANSQPVTADDPQIHAQLATQALARQRAAERQRSQIAANLAGAHLGSSGASDTGFNAVEQQRGEGEAHDIAQTMSGELQQRRGILQNLLGMAVQSGDTAAAQTLQAQLHSIDAQLNDQHFQADLGFRQSSFLDDLGYRLMALQLGANEKAGSLFL
jgi:hypothetical protein